MSLAFTVLAGLVLLVACFNIANVLLVRATVRQREMAIRAAIGAGRARLVRQHLTESLVLAILGGGAGLLLGWWASGFLSSLPLGTDLPITFNFQPDLRVYLFTLAAVVVTGAVVGIMPALRVARTDVNSMLREGGRGSSEGPRRHLVRNTLVMAQVAGSLLLLIVAGLFIRSAGKAREIDLGLNPDHVIDVPVDVQQLGYTEQQGRAFYRDAEERLRSLPGVVSVSQAFSVPLGLMSASERIIVEDHPLEAGQPEPVVYYNMVSPDYFETLRIALHRGRVFTKADSEKAAKVAIVNEAMAKKFWPSEEVLGKRFKVKGSAKADQSLIEVVGVVQNGKYRGVVEDLVARLLCADGTELYAPANDSRSHIGAARKYGTADRDTIAGTGAWIADFGHENAESGFGRDQRLPVLPPGSAAYDRDRTTWTHLGGRGGLQRGLLRRGAADPRNRYSYGARRETSGHSNDGSGAEPDRDRRRDCDRARSRFRGDPTAGEPFGGRKLQRSGDLRHCRGDLGGGRFAGLLVTGAPSNPRQSVGCAAIRIDWSRGGFGLQGNEPSRGFRLLRSESFEVRPRSL